jgi:glycosyltransferase involved in cell wall biosynthesis
MGKVVPVADAGAIAQAILDILADPEQFRGNYARIKDRYSPDGIAAGYEKLFEEILQGRK